jgi:DNA-binding NarL/FixJ family response regulator
MKGALAAGGPSEGSGGLPVRVVLTDDEALIRAGLALLVDAEPDLEVVGEAANGQEYLSLSATVRPEVVVMDVHMPVMDGVGATRRLASQELPLEGPTPGDLILHGWQKRESAVQVL